MQRGNIALALARSKLIRCVAENGAVEINVSTGENETNNKNISNSSVGDPLGGKTDDRLVQITHRVPIISKIDSKRTNP